MADFLLTHRELRRLNIKIGGDIFKVQARDVTEHPNDFKPAVRASLRLLLLGSTTISTIKFLLKIAFRRDAFKSLDNSIPRALALYTLANRLFGRLHNIPRSLIPTLASPALLLIKEPHLRFTLALYTLSAVAEAFYDLYSHLLPKGRIYNAIFSSNTIWMICQSRLLYSFVYHPDLFPPSYARIIFARSESYIQRPLPWVSAKSNWPSPRDVINFIASATEHTVPYPTLSESTPQLRQPVQPILDLSPAHSDHTQAICAALHPTEPSCLKHYLFALLRELKGAARFAGVLALVGALLRLKAGVRNPKLALRKILESTVQGAVLIGGSLTTSWATTCFLQKVLPNNALVKSRWSLHCIPSTLLLLALPLSRRRQLSMYCARLTADLEWRRLGGKGRHGWKFTGIIECLVFGLCMSALGRASDRDKRVVGGIYGGLYGGLYSTSIDYLREGAL